MTMPFHNRNLARRIVDTLVPPAHAAFDVGGECSGIFGICIDRTGSGNQVRVRTGFDGCVQDDRNVTLSASLTFSFSFGDFSVNGEYAPVSDNWSGKVTGPCPAEPEAEQSAARPSDVFTGERIQVASASEHIMLAGAASVDDLDLDWTADRGAPCAFDAGC